MQAITFTNKRLADQVIIVGQNIPWTSTVKYFGIYLDTKSILSSIPLPTFNRTWKSNKKIYDTTVCSTFQCKTKILGSRMNYSKGNTSFHYIINKQLKYFRLEDPQICLHTAIGRYIGQHHLDIEGIA